MIAYELLLEKIAAYQSDQTDEHLKQRLANEIVKANEGLCIYKAKNFVDSGVEWPELVNAARDGIYEAIKNLISIKVLGFQPMPVSKSKNICTSL